MDLVAQLTDFTLELPDGWLIREPDPARRAESFTHALDAEIGEQPLLAEQRDELLQTLDAFGEDADERKAVFAATVFIAVQPGLTATAAVLAFYGRREHPDDPDAEIHGLVRAFERDTVNGRPPEVAIVDLPAGKAVRLRTLENTTSANDGGVVTDMVQHWIPDPNRPQMVVISGSTPTLAFSTQFAQAFDGIAQTLRFLD